jgi:hypothetical protein
MAKYKKKKPSTASPSDEAQSSAIAKSPLATQKTPSSSADTEEKRPKKLATGSVKLQFAGDLVLVKNTQRPMSGLFKRYAELFEALANMEKDQRNLIYRYMLALILTSHARKATKPEEKKKLFDLKNDLYINMANERSLRRIFEFKYLISKNFRVIKYCSPCETNNKTEDLPRHRWKYCKACQVDHDFYNLLSMEVRFSQGYARLFLSNDQIEKLKGFRIQRKAKAGTVDEEAKFDRYLYNSRNLDAIDLDSALKLLHKLESQPLAIQTHR